MLIIVYLLLFLKAGRGVLNVGGFINDNYMVNYYLMWLLLLLIISQVYYKVSFIDHLIISVTFSFRTS